MCWKFLVTFRLPNWDVPDESTSDLARSTFSLVHWHEQRQGTYTQTSDPSSHNDLVDILVLLHSTTKFQEGFGNFWSPNRDIHQQTLRLKTQDKRGMLLTWYHFG